MFDCLDAQASSEAVAEAHIKLGNQDLMTVRAGGSGTHCWPSRPPFESYEVLLDHDPARFWSKYTDMAGMVYARVPRLLVTHHITRHGGASEVVCGTRPVRRTGMLNIKMKVTEQAEPAIWQALSNIEGAQMISQTFVLRE